MYVVVFLIDPWMSVTSVSNCMPVAIILKLSRVRLSLPRVLNTVNIFLRGETREAKTCD